MHQPNKLKIEVLYFIEFVNFNDFPEAVFDNWSRLSYLLMMFHFLSELSGDDNAIM